MARNDINGLATATIEIPRFDGQNTAQSFSEIGITEARECLNVLPGSVGSGAQRPGSIPITAAPIAPIQVLCNLRKAGTNIMLATSGTTVYKFNDATSALDALTMTNALNSANIDYAQFKDANANEVLVIADGGSLKYSDGTLVANITPAVNDATPTNAPVNVLADLNATHKPIGCLVHNNRLVVWDGSDTIWNSKIGYHDYFQATHFQRFVRENDSVQTCLSYSGALLVFMRRHIGVRFGDDYNSPAQADDWSQDFLDTTYGCANPNTVATVVFPDGREEVFYLSDKHVHAVYTLNTINLDNSARFATRSVSKKKIDWDKLGVTKAEWAKARGFFQEGLYWLVYPKGATWQGLVFNTQNEAWYPIDNIKANSFYADENGFYFAGNTGHIHKFDPALVDDWNDKAKAAGTPINWYWYSKQLTPGSNGFDHFWDILQVEARQFDVKSSIDVEVFTYRDHYTKPNSVQTANLVWGQTNWDESAWTNINFTDTVNQAERMRVFAKGPYSQIKLSNNRSEPVEAFALRFEVRPMT